jgi:hypothetical protein
MVLVLTLLLLLEPTTLVCWASASLQGSWVLRVMQQLLQPQWVWKTQPQGKQQQRRVMRRLKMTRGVLLGATVLRAAGMCGIQGPAGTEAAGALALLAAQERLQRAAVMVKAVEMGRERRGSKQSTVAGQLGSRCWQMLRRQMCTNWVLSVTAALAAVRAPGALRMWKSTSSSSSCSSSCRRRSSSSNLPRQ